MYNDYEREEIIDTAMDIFENTDATLEEAMGVAMENQMSKMKAEARKTGDWDKVITRQGLKDTGKNQHASKADDDYSRQHRWYSDKHSKVAWRYFSGNRPKSVPERFPGEQNTQAYKNRLAEHQRRFDNNANTIDRMIGIGKEHDKLYFDADRASRRMEKMGDYSKSVPANNGRGTKYRPKASKEAAIMDTALDFLDMYDVSLEEAIDMAYDYYEE